MQIKIVSDGTLGGTKIVDPVSGKDIFPITDITWHLSVDKGLAEVKITAILPIAELEADLAWMDIKEADVVRHLDREMLQAMLRRYMEK